MMAALAAGEPVTLDHVDQFVDGAAVNRAGTLTYLALSAAGDMVSVTTVDEGAVCTAMLDLYQNEGIIAEHLWTRESAGLFRGPECANARQLGMPRLHQCYPRADFDEGDVVFSRHPANREAVAQDLVSP